MSFEAQRRFLYQAKPEREVEKSEPFSAKKISPLRTIKKLYAHSHPLAKIIMAMHLHQKEVKLYHYKVLVKEIYQYF